MCSAWHGQLPTWLAETRSRPSIWLQLWPFVIVLGLFPLIGGFRALHRSRRIGAPVVEHDTDTTGAVLYLRSASDLKAKLVQGLASPASEMTDGVWAEMRQGLIGRHGGHK